MDFTEFINSKDIRKHLQDIGYRFNALEAAWLVYQSEDATLAEKHTAWQEIIDTAEDISVPENGDMPFTSSLHQLLRDYIKAESQWLLSLKAIENNTVYRISGWMEDLTEWLDLSPVFSTFEGSMKYIRNLIRAGDFNLFRIKKEYIDSDRSYCSTLNINGDILTIYANKCEDHHYKTVRDSFFNCLYFSFPTPFKQGDILHIPYGFPHMFSGPFVLINIDSETYTNADRQKLQSLKNCDMTVEGYFQLENTGQVIYDYTWNYMNMEYYTEPLNGKRRALKAFSSFMHEKIDASLLAEAYHRIMNENDIDPLSFYTNESRKLAGIDCIE